MFFITKNLGSPKSDPESLWIPLESTLESHGIPHKITSWKTYRTHAGKHFDVFFTDTRAGKNPSSAYLYTPWAESAHGIFDGNGTNTRPSPSQPPSSVYLNTPWAESAHGIFDGNGANPLSTPLFRLLKYSMG